MPFYTQDETLFPGHLTVRQIWTTMYIYICIRVSDDFVENQQDVFPVYETKFYLNAAGFLDTETVFQEWNLQRPTNLKLQIEQWGEHTKTLEVRFGKISSLQKCKFIRDIAGYFPNVGTQLFFKLTINSQLFIRFRMSKICDCNVPPSGLRRKPPRS